MSFWEIFLSSLEPVKEPLLAMAVVWLCLAIWLVWSLRRARPREERALDALRREERQAAPAPPLPAFRQFPAECPWQPEGSHTAFDRRR